MKKTLLFAAALFAAMQLFAVVLPEGTNARVADVKQDGDAIVEAELSQPTVLNTPIGPLECFDMVYFYKSGKLKACFLNTATKISTDIGVILICGSTRDHKYVVEFYESGALKQATVTDGYYEPGARKMTLFQSRVKTGLGEVVLGPDDFADRITFYDSGSPEKFQLRTFYLSRKNAEINFSCEAGSFKIDKSGFSSPFMEMSPYYYMQYPSGKMKWIYVADESFEINTPLGKTFGRGESPRTGEKYRVNLKEDGSVRSFITDDLIMTEIAGHKVNIPADSYLSFYANGNVCRFFASNKLTVAVANRQIEFPEDSEFRASEDGKKIISTSGYEFTRSDGGIYKTPKNYFVELIYDNGFPRKIVNADRTNVQWLDSNARYKLQFGDYYQDDVYHFLCFEMAPDYAKEITYKYKEIKKYHLQKGDKPNNVGMIYFAQNGIPSGYSMYKLGEFGELLLDENGLPIIDSENKKQFSKVELRR